MVDLVPRVGWKRAHNPEVVGSNPTPATLGAARLNLEAPFLLLLVLVPGAPLPILGVV